MIQGKPDDKEISLWACLHDGELEALTHDGLSQTVTLTWDVSFLWKFHNLPTETRFVIRLNEVRELLVLSFLPWPGWKEPSRDLPWSKQEEIRQGFVSKSAYISADWPTFLEGIKRIEYGCSSATLSTAASGQKFLSLGLMDYNGGGYPALRLLCSEVVIALNSGQELSFDEFLAMGAAYWDDFAERSRKLKSVSEAPKG